MGCCCKPCDDDRVHLVSNRTYPINILGYAATALDAQVVVKPYDDGASTIAFQVGDDLREDKKNVYSKRIDFVDHAMRDFEGNIISEYYARHSDIPDPFHPMVITITEDGQTIGYSKDSIYTDMYVYNPHAFSYTISLDGRVFVDSDEYAIVEEPYTTQSVKAHYTYIREEEDSNGESE